MHAPSVSPGTSRGRSLRKPNSIQTTAIPTNAPAVRTNDVSTETADHPLAERPDHSRSTLTTTRVSRARSASEITSAGVR